jgi:hypothetical protein
MSTLHVRRYIIVCRADVAAAANLAAKSADCDPVGGERAFTVGLSASGSAPAQAYICNWALTTPQAAAIRQRLRERGATVAETTPIVPGQTPASNRFAVFDADDWTPDQVLVACGMQRIGGAP